MLRASRYTLLACYAISLTSCRSETSKSGTTKSGGPELHADLENVAECFHAAVCLLQKEPRDEPMAAFLAEAKEKQGNPPDTRTADFALLHFDDSGTKLLTSAGVEISYKRGEAVWAHYSDGRAEVDVTYRFYCKGYSEQSKTTIIHSMGGGSRKGSE